MKERLLKIFVAASLIVAFILTCGQWTPVRAETAPFSTDFGVQDDERNTTVSGSELLQLLLDTQVVDAEANYIDQSGLYGFAYCDIVPASNITVKLTADGLLVTVSEWSYTAKNGERVCWRPISVTVNSMTKKVDGAGVVLFEGDFTATEGFDISADYETEFAIDASLYNSVVSYAYTAAVKKTAEISEYEAQKEKYENDLAAYNEYQDKLADYRLALSRYNIYLDTMEEFRQKQAKYEYYLERLEQYNLAKTAYDAYLVAMEAYNAEKALYDAYCKALDDYQIQSVRYNNYLNHVATRERILSAMEAIYTQDSLKLNLYDTVLSDTVDTVVQNKDEITAYTKTPAEAVDLAGECTQNLRRMLKEYRKLKKTSEKYTYYEEHYGELCKNFRYLYEALRTFYDNTIVYATLNSAGKLGRYRHFLAHLYVITTAMDDGYQRDETWSLEIDQNTYASIEDILEDVHIVSDTGMSSPKNYSGWPEEVSEPVKPEEVKRPVRPDEVAQPGHKPMEIIKPTAPETVEEPIAPDEVAALGTAPTSVKMTAAERAIVEALRNGTIGKRDEKSENVIIKKTTTVSKFIQDLSKHHVRFMNGNTVILECDIADGGMLVFPTESPVKVATDEFMYFFSCWKNEDGREAIESPVYSDMEFYASFTSERRSYPITWIVNGDVTTESFEYGTVPIFSGSTDKPMDERTIYTFIGWDNAPTRVTGEATYIAQYEDTERMYDVVWNINGTSITEKYKYGDKPAYNGLVDKSSDDIYVYSFDGWSPSVAPVTGNASYEALYSTDALVVDMMGNPLSVMVEDSMYVVETDGNSVDVTVLYEQALKKEYSITVKFKDCTLKISALTISRLASHGVTRLAASVDENGARFVMCDATGAVIDGGDQVILECDHLDETGAEMFTRIDGLEEPVYIEDGKLVLLISSGQNIMLVKRYTATVTPFEFGSFTLSQEHAEAGAEIKLIQDTIQNGYVIKQINVISRLSGEPVEFDDKTMTFKMPVGGVTVDVVCERQTFNVRFVSEGKVISEKTYYLGDTVEIPEDPTKDPMGKYTYTFFGWTPEIVLVDGDAEYTAIFTEHKIADEIEMSEHNFQNREYEWLILFGVVAVVVTGGCVAISCFKKSKRAKKSKFK